MVNQGQPHLRIIRKGMLAFFVFITGKYRNISGKNRWLHSCGLFLSSFLFFSGFASAQQVVGVVTALKGQAQLTRAATQTALRFKDSIILRDTIDTRERSLTRILLGGKSTITLSELSRLEVREEILPSGATRSILDLSFGSVLVSVARRLLGRGDEVQIRTGNAVAFVRGSTIFAQTNPLTFTVLSGAAIVTFPGLAPVTLGPLQSVTFSAARDPRGEPDADSGLCGNRRYLPVEERLRQR